MQKSGVSVSESTGEAPVPPLDLTATSLLYYQGETNVHDKPPKCAQSMKSEANRTQARNQLVLKSLFAGKNTPNLRLKTLSNRDLLFRCFEG
jgi:hypothetical protein